MTRSDLDFVLALGILAAGCGDDGGKAAADAPAAIDARIDAGADAPPATGSVTLDLANLATPSASTTNIPVSFADASGAPAVQTMTDANASVTATITAGSSATFAVTSAGSAVLITILDLQPGDHVRVNQPGQPFTPVGTANVTVPADNTVTLYTKAYTVSTGQADALNATTLTTAFALDSRAVSDGTYGVVAYEANASSPLVPLKYVSALNNTAPTPTAPASVTLPATWKTDFKTAAITVANATGATGAVEMKMSPCVADHCFRATTSSATFASGAATGTLSVANDAFTSYAYQARVLVDAHTVVVFESHATSLGASFDYASAVPHATALAVTPGANNTLVAAVQTSAPPTNAAGMIVGITYVYATTPATKVASQLIVAPVGTTVTTPQLGSALAQYAPATPFTASGLTVLFAGGGNYASPADFRQNWSRTLIPTNDSELAPAPTGTGVTTTTEFLVSQ